MKKNRQCQECEEEAGSSPLRQRIWEAQLSKREIILNGEINDSVVELVVTQIQNFNALDDACEEKIKGYEREPIKLFINTYGGEIYSALSVCSAIHASKTEVHTIALGKALSAGFIILVCGHIRYAQKYSTLMYHTGSSGTMGVITDIIEEAEALEHLNSKIHRLILDNTNIEIQQLEEVFLRKNNWYLDIQEALELGVIDKIYGEDYDDTYNADQEDYCQQCIEAGADDFGNNCENCLSS